MIQEGKAKTKAVPLIDCISGKPLVDSGGPSGIRTQNPGIMSPLR